MCNRTFNLKGALEKRVSIGDWHNNAKLPLPNTIGSLFINKSSIVYGNTFLTNIHFFPLTLISRVFCNGFVQHLWVLFNFTLIFWIFVKVFLVIILLHAHAMQHYTSNFLFDHCIHVLLLVHIDPYASCIPFKLDHLFFKIPIVCSLITMAFAKYVLNLAMLLIFGSSKLFESSMELIL